MLAAAGHYPHETRFYADLRKTQRVYPVGPRKNLAGPWVEIYRL